MKHRKILWSKHTSGQDYKLEVQKKSQSVAVDESNWNLLLPPLGRAPATSPQHKPCLLLPVAKCGFSFGHVKLKTSYSKNCSEFATSALCCLDGTIRTLLLQILLLDLRGNYMRRKSFSVDMWSQTSFTGCPRVFVQGSSRVKMTLHPI